MFKFSLFQYELYRFHAQPNNSKWLLDAILNILASATLADSGKCTFIRDLNRKVFAKFHLCTVKINDFMKKTIIENGGWTPS